MFFCFVLSYILVTFCMTYTTKSDIMTGYILDLISCIIIMYINLYITKEMKLKHCFMAYFIIILNVINIIF